MVWTQDKNNVDSTGMFWLLLSSLQVKDSSVSHVLPGRSCQGAGGSRARTAGDVPHCRASHPLRCQGTPSPSGLDLYLLQVFSSPNQQKLAQGVGTGKGGSSLQHGLGEQLQPGHVAGVGGTNLLQNLDPSAMGRDKGAPTGQEDLWEYSPGPWKKGDSVLLAWEHLCGKPRP